MADRFVENEQMEAPDEVDGGGLSCLRKNDSDEENSENNIAKRFADSLVLSKSSKYAEFYSMNYKYNGYLLILAHSTFTVGNKEDRKAAGEDIQMLRRSFSRLNFKIEVHENLRLQELQNVIMRVSSMDFENYATFALAVSSHGNPGLFFAKDATYDPDEELFEPFKKNESLFGKPKIFFLEPCRGISVDDGVTLLSSVETDGNQLEEVTIPREADILLVYATVEGYIAFQNNRHGSQFFIYLTEALNTFAGDHDLLSILILANQRLSIDFESYNSKAPKWSGKKQCMCIVHTLTRRIMFKL
ncbi:hypothetical protein HHI36_019548 [Cryptolaemus montrouzieri]|uniref:Caspase-3 n=1 Tax=Cryptolaemus montrouzieri TaxID=559131 RepID=A0ABD2N854_9CUCU